MVWGKTGTTTLTTAGTTVTTPTMTPSKFNVTLGHTYGTGSVNTRLRVGVDSIDTGNNYSNRYADNGGSDDTSETTANVIRVSARDYDELNVVYGCNIAGEEKLFYGFTVNVEATAITTAPTRTEFVAKWVTTAGQYKLIQWLNASADFPVGSNISALGSDLGETAIVPAIPSLVKSLQSPSVGGWKEVARTTLGSAGDTISVTDLANKRYYMVLTDAIASGNLYPELELNGDATSGNYRYRRAINGGTDSTGAYVALFPTNTPVATTETYFAVSYLSNLSTKEKIGMSNDVFSEASAATNAPTRQRHVSKWTNTSDAINRIDRSEDGSGTYNTNSEVVVLGWDPADTHTTNFWEELASVELDSGNVRLSSGTITAKKYLWFQYYIKGASSCRQKIQFNEDTDTNYAFRYSANGGADSGSQGQAYPDINASYAYANNNKFGNMFVINNASNIKILTGNSMETTSGAGSAINTMELAGKWVNTSDQITQIDIWADGGSTAYDTGSILKVWGHD